MSIAFKAGSFVGFAGKATIKGFLGIGTATSKLAGNVVDAAHKFGEGVADGFADPKVNKRKPVTVKASAAQPTKTAATKKAAAPVRRTRTKSVAA